MYKRTIGIEPTNVPALFNLSLLSAQTGNLDAAKQYQELLKSIDPVQAKLLARCLRVMQG